MIKNDLKNINITFYANLKRLINELANIMSFTLILFSERLFPNLIFMVFNRNCNSKNRGNENRSILLDLVF
jgi:hypothetical protein